VAVADALDHPRGPDVDEHREIVRLVRALEHTHDIHFQWVNAGEVEHRLRRRQQRIARPEPEFLGHARAEHCLAEQRDLPARDELEPAKIEIIERGADDRKTARLESRVQRYRVGQPRVPQRVDRAHRHQLRHLVVEVERVHDQIERAAPGADQQRRRLCARQQLALALGEQHLERQRQRRDQRHAGDQRQRAQTVEHEILPGEVERVHYPPSPSRKSRKSTTRSKRGNSS
jgi:site-specific recombinase